MSNSREEEIRHTIALSMVPSVGPVTARMLIEELGSATRVMKAEPETLITLAKSKGSQIGECLGTGEIYRKADGEIRFMENKGIRPVLFSDAEFPFRLNECRDGPLLLYARGRQCLNSDHLLGVVGTRRASAYGRDQCRNLISGLARHVPDAVIVSGLAYGIDVIAHRAALECGLDTVAVLGHGLQTLYPSSHRETARKIMDQGCLVSDFDSGMGPERNNFLRRNRIIAGMTECTLIVESSERGGALTTASMAISYNRNVLALPGRVTDPRSVGCNNLIKRNMAGLICTPSDLVDALGWESRPLSANEARSPEKLSPTQEVTWRVVRDHPGIDPGSISIHCGIPIQEVMAALLELEIAGHLGSEAGNRYCIRS